MWLERTRLYQGVMLMSSSVCLEKTYFVIFCEMSLEL